MPLTPEQILRFLKSAHPQDALPEQVLQALGPVFEVREIAADAPFLVLGEVLAGLFIVHESAVEITGENNVVASRLSQRNQVCEPGLLRDGQAMSAARAKVPATLLVLPAGRFHALMAEHETVARFYNRSRGPRPRRSDLATSRVETLIAVKPITCKPDTSAQDAARKLHEKRVSSLCVTAPKKELVGIVSQSDLTCFQAVCSAELVCEISAAATPAEIVAVTACIPQLLVQRVARCNRHEIATRLITDITDITDIADTATRQLLALAELKFGPPSVPYLWLACGSQGRQEQTGVSDQDN